MINKSDFVRLEVRIPRESYERIKSKAQASQLSINQFLNRAGSLTSIEQAVTFPLNNAGAISLNTPLPPTTSDVFEVGLSRPIPMNPKNEFLDLTKKK